MLWGFRNILGLIDMISNRSFYRFWKLAMVADHCAQPLLLQSHDVMPSHAPRAPASVPHLYEGGCLHPAPGPALHLPCRKTMQPTPWDNTP